MATGERLDRDDIGVVVGGVVAVGAAFLPWYESRDGAVSLTGWGLGITALLAIFLAAYAAGRVVFMRGRPQKPDVPVTPQAETFVAAGAAVLLIVYRILDAPGFGGEPGQRAYGIVVAGLAMVLQLVCTARKIGRTGVRAQ